ESRSIHYVVVGDPRSLPVVDSDLDLVVDPPGFRAIQKDLELWFNDRHELLQILRHEAKAITYVVAGRGADCSSHLLHLDICTDYVRNARAFLTSSYLLE